MEELVNKDHDDNNENITVASMNTMVEGEWTYPYITPPAIMVKFNDMKHNDKNDNETETSLDTLDNKTEKFPDITSPAMMEECGNK